MATTFTWEVVQLDRNPTTDAIETVHWVVSGVDAADATLTGRDYSTHNLPAAPEGAPFVPYEDVTEAQVLNWCFASGLDKAGREGVVQAQIESARDPELVSGKPW